MTGLELVLHDVVPGHTAGLAGTPARVASGDDDPFHPGVVALARRLPARAEVHFSGGGHDDDFFFSQQPASLAFLGRHLVA